MGDDLIVGFEQWERRRNLSPRTMLDRRLRLRSLGDHLPTGDLLDATRDDIETWMDRCRISPASRYTYINAVAAFYRWAVREGYLLVDPCERVARPQRPRRVPRPLTIDQVRVLLDQAPSPRMALWVALGAYAGFRVSEMAHLQVPEVLFSRGKLVVAGGKGDKDGVVPMHDEVRRRLRGLPMPRGGYVTPKEDRSPYRPKTVSAYVSAHMEACEVDGVPHQLRHFFVTEVAERGGIEVAREAARHASMQTTVGYAQLTRGRVDVAVLAVGSGVCGGCPVDGGECPLGKV